MRRLAKTSLIWMAEEHGIEYVLDLDKVMSPSINADERIKEYFKMCLGRDDLSTVSMQQLAEVLHPEITIERLSLLDQSSPSPTFVTIGKACEEGREEGVNEVVGFKS